MNTKEQQIAIVEACGWKRHSELDNTWCAPKQSNCPLVCDLIPLPDDLNLMHEAEKTLTDEQRSIFVRALDGITGNANRVVWRLIHATAAERAKAFLQAVGKWEDEPAKPHDQTT